MSPLADKKNANRFQFTFDENDPVQAKAAEILSQKPRTDIKQYVAECIMVRVMAHYTVADWLRMNRDFANTPDYHRG